MQGGEWAEDAAKEKKEAHHVDDLLALLELALRALNELRVRAHGVVVARAGEGTPQHCDPSCGFVDCDHVARLALPQRVQSMPVPTREEDGRGRGHLGRAFSFVSESTIFWPRS